MAQIYAGDIGVTITIDTGIDLSAALTTNIYVKMPDGSLVIWVATVTKGSTGLNSALIYVTKKGDLAEAGTYDLQPYITSPAFTGYGTTTYLQVLQLFT